MADDPLDHIFDDDPPAPEGRAAIVAFLDEQIRTFEASLDANPSFRHLPFAHPEPKGVVAFDAILWNERDPHALNHFAYLAGLYETRLRWSVSEAAAEVDAARRRARDRIMWGADVARLAPELRPDKPKVAVTPATEQAKDAPEVLAAERRVLLLQMERDVYEKLGRRLSRRCALFMVGDEEEDVDQQEPGKERTFASIRGAPAAQA